MTPDQPDPLDDLLNRRKRAPRLDVTPEIWRRIARAECRDPGFDLRATIDSWFARWSFATLFVTTCVLVGLLIAEVRINQLDRERNAQIARSYLVLINPMQPEPPHSARP